MIKLFEPYFDDEEEKALIKTLQSHFWASGAGRGRVNEFEDAFRKYIDCDSCVAVNSGTAALHLALQQLDIKGKDVLVPSLTFVSTVSSILHCGGKPIFIDVDETTLCMDIEDIKKKFSSQTTCILPVDFGGIPCEIEEISAIAKEKDITIIEDAAHACGAIFKGKKIGSHNEMVCFSFHPVKNLAMPTGGAIALNGKFSSKRNSILKSQRWCGIDNREGVYYDVPRLGWNYYMNEFSAAIGLCQLKKLDNLNEKRKKIAHRYHDEITLENKMPFSEDCGYHLYWIRVKTRTEFIKKMNKVGIEVGVHYLPVHKMTLFKSSLELPVTELVGSEIVSLPIHPNLKESDVNKIIKYTNEFC